MKVLRYLFIIAVALIGIVFFINIPNLAKAMLETVSAISWQDWLKYVIGILIGTVATYIAMKSKKKVVIEEETSID